MSTPLPAALARPRAPRPGPDGRQPVWPRRAFHLVGGSLIPVAALLLPLSVALWTAMGLALLAVGLETARALFPWANRFALRSIPLFKPTEDHRVTGATYLLLASCACLLLFDRPVAVLALLFLSVGDPAAACAGLRARRLRLFDKSLAGTLAFVVCAGAAGALAALHPTVPLAWWLLPGVAAAALVELLPIPLDDNLTVPLASGGLTQLLGG